MAALDPTFHCPGCGASLSLFVEPIDRPGDGVLVCEHGHVYDLANDDDDQLLQGAYGPAYRRRLVLLAGNGVYGVHP